ncbi:8285_t:CDS:2 [Gigaspora margarita]|uniref:8285_t:CDS:1 n=1 Tax=Gigaspora margarita TaxID=4874 RepID=A0ABN7V7D3_GIGMA|nr:8285_t:CDS:2 [Gigaspora margarita]
MSEGQMLNYEEILNHLDKYDELIEVREEGAEIKEYLDSLTEDQRQEFYPTVDEFLRKLQSEKKVKDQVSEVDDEIIDNETKDQLTNLTIKSREKNYERPGFEGRHLPKLIQMLERGTTDRLPKKFKRKLGKRQINPRANSKIRKYVATHGFQPSPMLNDDDV